MAISITYADFQRHNSALVVDGGPWRTEETSVGTECSSSSADFCLDYVRCVLCVMNIQSLDRMPNTKYLVNISVPLAQYGNANSLDFNFAYNLAWASNNTAAGAPLSSTLSVGSASYTDNFVSTQWSSPSLGNPFSHSGATTLSKSSDGTIGYIPITIDFTFARELGSQYSWFMKGLGLQITTPINSVSAESSTSTSTQSGSATSTTIVPSQVSLPGFSQYPALSSAESAPVGSNVPSSSGSSSSGSSSSGSSTKKTSNSAIIGGVIGGIALLSILVLLLLRAHKRNLKEFELAQPTRWNGGVNIDVERGDGVDLTDTPMKTSHSESFPVTTPGIRSGEKAERSYHDSSPISSTIPAPTPTPAPTTAPFIIPSSPQPATSSNEARTSGVRQHREERPEVAGRRSRRTGRRRLVIDVPPPAYSTISGTNGHNHSTTEDDMGSFPTSSRTATPRLNTALSASPR